MTKTLTLSLAAGALLLAGTALAQTPPAAPTARAAMPEMTRDAAQSRAAQMFTRLDANADGQIDASDRQDRVPNRAETRFDRIDANTDGSISREEFAAVGAMGRGMGRDGQRGGGRRGEGRMGRGGEMIGAADADSNGTITQAEFNSAFLARFDAADANDDGVVSREERRAARPQGMGQGRGDGRRGHRGMGR